MTDMFDVAVSATIGTGVAKTQLNGAASLLTPQNARCLKEVIGYQAESGAYTAAQSLLTEVHVESNAFPIVPKRFILPPIGAGLGTSFGTLIPIIEAMECNSPINGVGAIDYFGQAQVANTVAPRVGVGVHYNDIGPQAPEIFYNKPADETSTGTTAVTKVAGGTITISGGARIVEINGAVSAGTVTLSEDYIGFLSFESNDFINTFALRVPNQPTASSLGTLVGTQTPKMSRYKNIDVPMQTNATVSTFYTQEEALTAAGNFINGVGYTKV